MIYFYLAAVRNLGRNVIIVFFIGMHKSIVARRNVPIGIILVGNTIHLLKEMGNEDLLSPSHCTSNDVSIRKLTFHIFLFGDGFIVELLGCQNMGGLISIVSIVVLLSLQSLPLSKEIAIERTSVLDPDERLADLPHQDLQVLVVGDLGCSIDQFISAPAFPFLVCMFTQVGERPLGSHGKDTCLIISQPSIRGNFLHDGFSTNPADPGTIVVIQAGIADELGCIVPSFDIEVGQASSSQNRTDTLDLEEPTTNFRAFADEFEHLLAVVLNDSCGLQEVVQDNNGSLLGGVIFDGADLLTNGFAEILHLVKQVHQTLNLLPGGRILGAQDVFLDLLAEVFNLEQLEVHIGEIRITVLLEELPIIQGICLLCQCSLCRHIIDFRFPGISSSHLGYPLSGLLSFPSHYVIFIIYNLNDF